MFIIHYFMGFSKYIVQVSGWHLWILYMHCLLNTSNITTTLATTIYLIFQSYPLLSVCSLTWYQKNTATDYSIRTPCQPWVGQTSKKLSKPWCTSCSRLVAEIFQMLLALDVWWYIQLLKNLAFLLYFSFGNSWSSLISFVLVYVVPDYLLFF